MRWTLTLLVATVLLGVAAARAGTLIVGPLYEPPVENVKVFDITLPAPVTWFTDITACSPNRLVFLQAAEDLLFEIADGEYELHDYMYRERRYCEFLMQRN